jgi:hypothetical protein
MMRRWQDFLDSLSTKGGNVFMLFLCLVFLYGVMLHVIHDANDSPLISVVHDMVVGFGGALLGGLSGNSSRQQMADRVNTALNLIPPSPDLDPDPKVPDSPISPASSQTPPAPWVKK